MVFVRQPIGVRELGAFSNGEWLCAGRVLNDFVLVVRESFVHIKAQHFVVGLAGIVIADIPVQASKILHVLSPNQIVQALGVGEKVMRDLVQAERPLGTRTAAPPKAALIHFV